MHYRLILFIHVECQTVELRKRTSLVLFCDPQLLSDMREERAWRRVLGDGTCIRGLTESRGSGRKREKKFYTMSTFIWLWVRLLKCFVRKREENEMSWIIKEWFEAISGCNILHIQDSENIPCRDAF